MIIGVAGPIGSGKTTVAEIFEREWGFSRTSLSDMLREELRRRGMEITREHLQNVGAELRQEHGKSVLADMALEKVGEAGGDWVIESVRVPEEAMAIQQKGVMLAVTAPDEIRFKRIMSRQRSEGDKAQTLETFREKDAHDRKIAGIDATLDICDYVIENSGSLDELKDALDQMRKKL